MSDWGANLTSSMMLNPFMFSPVNQMTNADSPYPSGALPYPGSYSGGPVDAATGRPLQSYQNAMAAANQQYQQQLAAYNAAKAAQSAPGGTTLNSSPYSVSYGGNVTGQAPPTGPSSPNPNWSAAPTANNPLGAWGGQGNYQSRMMGLPDMGAYNAALSGHQGQNQASALATASMSPPMMYAAPQPQQQQGPAAPTPPNNWRAALAALASPPTPGVVGAPIPAGGGGWGFQPASGINNAFLGSLAGGPGPTGGTSITPQGAGAFRPSAITGMGGGTTQIGNPGFLAALAAIQNRPQQGT